MVVDPRCSQPRARCSQRRWPTSYGAGGGERAVVRAVRPLPRCRRTASHRPRRSRRRVRGRSEGGPRLAVRHDGSVVSSGFGLRRRQRRRTDGSRAGTGGRGLCPRRGCPGCPRRRLRGAGLLLTQRRQRAACPHGRRRVRAGDRHPRSPCAGAQCSVRRASLPRRPPAPPRRRARSPRRVEAALAQPAGPACHRRRPRPAPRHHHRSAVARFRRGRGTTLAPGRRVRRAQLPRRGQQRQRVRPGPSRRRLRAAPPARSVDRLGRSRAGIGCRTGRPPRRRRARPLSRRCVARWLCTQASCCPRKARPSG